jgi:outer membrane protein assembly factor BamB
MNDSTAELAPGERHSRAGSGKPGRDYQPLRVWPALLFLILMVAARFGPGLVEGGGSKYWMVAMFGPILCCLLLFIWWLAASRANWRERVFGAVVLLGGAALMVALADPTMRGAATSYLTLPSGFALFAVMAFLLGRRRPIVRTPLMVMAAIGGFAVSTLLRNEGMTGDYAFTLRWRWTPTQEEALLAAQKTASTIRGAPARGTNLTATLAQPEWPAFRGLDRSGRSSAPPIATNWIAQPPELLWKIQVGPGWSSFAVAGSRLFTQEQRGPNEAVICYDADTGAEIWRAEFEARLEDPMGGPGPRATPTLAEGALFATGATGIFLRIDPGTGEIVWQKALSEIAGRSKMPMWGFSASSLVVGSVVIVYAGGPGDKGLLAFDAATGDLRWSVASGSESYVSPQLKEIHGEKLVAMFCNERLLLLDPGTGQTRLDYEWKVQTYRAVQPHFVDGPTVLLTTGMNHGTRAIRLAKSDGQLTAEEAWTSRQLKTDFVDLVSHQGYVYGNDNGILTCLDLTTGERKWKDGRYGKGQLLLLENSGLILIAAEQGNAVLVAADPAAHREVASFKALEGKTWNHPVVVGDRLYLRN